MSLHDADILARLSRFLARKQMPRRFEGKPLAEEDETRALCAAVARNAPRDPQRLAVWWPTFEAGLGEACGAMWPSEKEIGLAAKAAAKDALPTDSGLHVIDEVELTANRMRANEHVGEGWLWGSQAVALIASGRVTRELMERYRSGAFLNRKRAYGEAAALAWEAEAKARHEAAKAVWRARHEQTELRDTTSPDMRPSARHNHHSEDAA